jgi:uncharacterized protein YbjT (DUF2867 family)
VLGATKYVGGRLFDLLLHKEWKVRADGRSLERLNFRPHASHSDYKIITNDLFDRESLSKTSKDVRFSKKMIKGPSQSTW